MHGQPVVDIENLPMQEDLGQATVGPDIAHARRSLKLAQGPGWIALPERYAALVALLRRPDRSAAVAPTGAGCRAGPQQGPQQNCPAGAEGGLHGSNVAEAL
jgi:hypothetical protein